MNPGDKVKLTNTRGKFSSGGTQATIKEIIQQLDHQTYYVKLDNGNTDILHEGNSDYFLTVEIVN